MRTRRTFVAAVAALALVAAACGGDDDANGDGGTASSPADLTGQQVEIAAVWVEPEQGRFRKVLDQFEANTGAEVTFTSTGDDIGAVIGTRIEGGNPPDVAILPQPGLLVDYANAGRLQPIEDLAGDLVDEHYAPVWRELGTVDDTLYGVWFKASNKSTVWYRTDSFSDAGVEPPADWDGMLTAAQTLSDSGVTPFSIGGADGWTLTDWFENIYLRTAGGETYDKLTRHEIPWTDDTVKTALTTFAEVVGKPEWIAGGTDGALSTDFTNSVVQTFTDPPKAAIVYEGDFVAGVISGSTDAEVGTDAKFFPFPNIDGSKPSVLGGGDVAVLMKDSAAGKELIKFLATPEAGDIWAAEGGFASPNKGVDLAKYPDDISRSIAESIVQAETFRFDMSDLQPAAFGSTTGKGMWGLLQDFVRNPSDVDGIAAKLEAAAEAAFG